MEVLWGIPHLEILCLEQSDYNSDEANATTTYGHIKEFLVTTCGYDHWNDLDKDHKQAIISRWQQVPYPDWDETIVKSYQKTD